jgi:hypothetical protein
MATQIHSYNSDFIPQPSSQMHVDNPQPKPSAPLDATPIDLTTTVPNLHRIPPLEHNQSPVQTLLTIAPTIDKLALQRGKAGTPTDGQPAPQLVLDLAHFLHELATALALALGDGVHGGGEEEPDGLVDVRFCRDGGEGEFGERFCDAHDCF